MTLKKIIKKMKNNYKEEEMIKALIENTKHQIGMCLEKSDTWYIVKKIL